jgi:hypothetical protein
LQNADASDISLGDLLVITSKIKDYMASITLAVEAGNAAFR